MPIRFTHLDSAQEVDCYAHLNLLAHAQILELDLGSTCGGHGVCGKDRIRLNPSDVHKISPPTEKEMRHLSAEEIGSGVRLSCQCFPVSDDLDIEVR